ncbi:hypothetical protein DCM90_06770 [Levilactobacillus bambusae]|uniref:Uncharacterized protein n=2 Tax=Levilactobacillus bambusae TaxID=2024736 RepID=A0A2V1MXM7_9LACO|nr:hypothetical protein DCM90_06770 [Levilactobacillus bambusae]
MKIGTYEGFEPTFAQQLYQGMTVSLNDLTLRHVSRRVARLEPDWMNLLLLVNLKGQHSPYQSLVWEAKRGIYATKQSTNRLLNQLVDHSCYTRQEISLRGRYQQRHGVQPYVRGKMQLIPITVQQHSNYTWLSNMTAWTYGPEQDGGSTIIFETGLRLKTELAFQKVRHRIKTAQQITAAHYRVLQELQNEFSPTGEKITQFCRSDSEAVKQKTWLTRNNLLRALSAVIVPEADILEVVDVLTKQLYGQRVATWPGYPLPVNQIDQMWDQLKWQESD